MGSSNYNDSMYSARIDAHNRAGTSAFTHDADIKSGRASNAVHEHLDPKKLNGAGMNVRESFDSDTHPDSVPVAILFDVTGSMSTVPRIFVNKLGKLMALLVKKGYLAHPHILFGAIGDATCDKVPLQIGQFEAGNEMDEALTKMVLEGGGGGHITESYELGAYYLARHAVLDSLTKRGKKGFLFFMGDELPYPTVNRHQVESLIGDPLEANIRFSASDPRGSDANGDVLAELREKFEVFWIMPGGTSHWDDKSVNDVLKAMFGQNRIRLEDPADVCELIATTIGVCEGYDIDTIKTDLVNLGADKKSVDAASGALVPFTKSRAVGRSAVASGALVMAGTDKVERL